MKLAIVVYGAPYSTQASASALRFARTAHTMGHEIVRVFFYHDAVHVANDLVVAPQDEVDLATGWADLAERSRVQLAVCIAASLKRGVTETNLKSAFEIVGLGQLVDAASAADRFLTFAA